MKHNMAELSLPDILGLVEERKHEWCLLAVSDDGHPTFACPGCFAMRITVRSRGAELPRTCASCKRPLKLPAHMGRLARTLIARGGHHHLIPKLMAGSERDV